MQKKSFYRRRRLRHLFHFFIINLFLYAVYLNFIVDDIPDMQLVRKESVPKTVEQKDMVKIR